MASKLVAIWLSIICIVVFILQNLIQSLTDVLLLSQNSFFQPWRFLTAIFLHASLSHLTLNLFALILFGLILESLVGSRKFLLIFMVSGIFANLIAIFFYSSSLGASGAIFGVIGALTILKPKMTVWAFSLPMPMVLAAALWALGDVLGIFMPSGTGNIAHLSGLAFGLVFSLLSKPKFKVIQKHNPKLFIPEEEIKNWEKTWLR